MSEIKKYQTTIAAQFAVVLAICLVSGETMAVVPTTLKFSNRSFQIQAGSVFGDSSKELNQEEIKLQLEDPTLKTDELAITYYRLSTAVGSLSKKNYNAQFDKIKKDLKQNADRYDRLYSPQVRAYIETIALNHQAKVHKEGNQKLLSIPDGTAFFRDVFAFEGVKDPLIKTMVISLFGNLSRQQDIAGPLEKIVSKIYTSPAGNSYLFSEDEYSEQDLNNLKEIVKDKDYRFEKIGKTWVFGSGFGYLILKDLLEKGQKLQDPALKAKFEKIVRYHVNFQIPVTHEAHQGAAAFFRPLDNSMTFVLPSRGDLNSYTHEMTHSRFNKFTEDLDRWTRAKGYVVPYQIDGPSLGGMAALFAAHGGLFNLLNEINSWRIGESFDGRGTDAEILKTLKQKYGPQAGYESTELLQKVWTPAMLKGKSIPYLIYNEIREFNKMSNEDLIMMGYEGSVQKDATKKINFLLMYQSKRFNNTDVEADAKFVLDEIARTSDEKNILDRLERIDTRYKISSQTENKKIDLSAATLSEVLSDFIQTGSSESTELLKTKFLNDIGPEHMDAIVARAMQVKTAFFEHEAVEVLTAVFEKIKVTRTVKSEKGSLKNRKTVDSKILQAIDASMSERLYDGGLAIKKMSILNFISAYTYPEELPLTYNKTLNIYKNHKQSHEDDAWLARLFLMPKDYGAESQVFWGEKLIDDLKGFEVHASIREGMGFFYKEAMSSYLSQSFSYGKYAIQALNSKRRVLLLREMARLSDAQKLSLDKASLQLWKLAGDENLRVRTAAIYAILQNPMFLIKNEGRLQYALNMKDARYQQTASFLLESGSSMAPKAKRMFDIQQRKESTSVVRCERVLL